MDKTVEGIVISETAYSESSKIIKLITKDLGIISCMAKGSRKLKSDLRVVTTKLTYGNFHIIYKDDKISTLVSVDILDNFKYIKQDIDAISYSSFIIELSEQVMKQNKTSEIFNLLVSSLKKINDKYDPLVITNILELKYLDFLGVMPVIDGCSICSSTNSIATLSASAGGYICNDCLTNQRMVNSKTIKLIRMFNYIDISKIEKTEISDSVKKEINSFLDEYYDRYTGLYLKSKSFLNNLNKIK